MPWSSKDALSHTKKASTSALQSLWAKVANAALASGDSDGSEGSAIRQANDVIARRKHSTVMVDYD